MRLRFADQAVSNPVPKVEAEWLGQGVDEISAPRLIDDPRQCCEQMPERSNTAGLGSNRLLRHQTSPARRGPPPPRVSHARAATAPARRMLSSYGSPGAIFWSMHVQVRSGCS